MDKLLIKYWLRWKILKFLFPGEYEKYRWSWYKSAYYVRKRDYAIMLIHNRKHPKNWIKCKNCGYKKSEMMGKYCDACSILKFKNENTTNRI